MSGGEWAQFVLADAPESTVEGTSGEVGNGEEDRDHAEEEGDCDGWPTLDGAVVVVVLRLSVKSFGSLSRLLKRRKL
jgi:hypothetical protein